MTMTSASANDGRHIYALTKTLITYKSSTFNDAKRFNSGDSISCNRRFPKMKQKHRKKDGFISDVHFCLAILASLLATFIFVVPIVHVFAWFLTRTQQPHWGMHNDTSRKDRFFVCYELVASQTRLKLLSTSPNTSHFVDSLLKPEFDSYPSSQYSSPPPTPPTHASPGA